jgi:hypothetical protein
MTPKLNEYELHTCPDFLTDHPPRALGEQTASDAFEEICPGVDSTTEALHSPLSRLMRGTDMTERGSGEVRRDGP